MLQVTLDIIRPFQNSLKNQNQNYRLIIAIAIGYTIYWQRKIYIKIKH